MNLNRKSVFLIILGMILVIAGFIPFTRTDIVTGETLMEKTEYTEEVKTKEEVYTEEQVVGEEEKTETIWKESVTATRASTKGKEFELKKGDTIYLTAHADDTVMISFSGQGYVYLSMEMGTDIEKEYTIQADGTHTLLYSPASVTSDTTIDFEIVRTYVQPIVESVEKTRTVEYTEKVPHTVHVPVTEQTARYEQYTLSYLRYLGVAIMALGGVWIIREIKSPSPSTQSKKASRTSRKK